MSGQATNGLLLELAALQLVKSCSRSLIDGDVFRQTCKMIYVSTEGKGLLCSGCLHSCLNFSGTCFGCSQHCDLLSASQARSATHSTVHVQACPS